MNLQRASRIIGTHGRLWATSLFIGVVFWIELSSANVGVFCGDGFTVELQKTAQIQMVSESVSFEFVGAAHSRGYSVGTGIPGDYVAVNGSYELRNLTDSIVRIQIGFPLNSDQVRHKNIRVPLAEEPASSTFPRDLQLAMGFVVRDSSGKYPVRYVAQDSSRRFRGIFLWDMKFAPNELKVLHVRYDIELSFTLAEMDTLYAPYAKDWYGGLSGAYLEYFEYVTATARSWAGPIRHATFRAKLDSFESYLLNRGLMLQSEYDTWLADADVDTTRRRPPPFNKTLIYRRLSPAGWQARDSMIEWSFENYAADSNLSFEFWLSMIPRNPSGIDSLIVLAFGQYPKSEDLADLRDIIAAFMGIPPQTERVVEYARRQVWYATQRWITEDQLSENERRLLDRIARLIDNSSDSR